MVPIAKTPSATSPSRGVPRSSVPIDGRPRVSVMDAIRNSTAAPSHRPSLLSTRVSDSAALPVGVMSAPSSSASAPVARDAAEYATHRISTRER